MCKNYKNIILGKNLDKSSCHSLSSNLVQIYLKMRLDCTFPILCKLKKLKITQIKHSLSDNSVQKYSQVRLDCSYIRSVFQFCETDQKTIPSTCLIPHRKLILSAAPGPFAPVNSESIAIIISNESRVEQYPLAAIAITIRL